MAARAPSQGEGFRLSAYARLSGPLFLPGVQPEWSAIAHLPENRAAALGLFASIA